MKILKTYEKYSMKNKKNYWLIPVDYRFHVALLKINVPDSFKKEMLYFYKLNRNLTNESYIYIGCDYSNENHIWKWSLYKDVDTFKKDNYIFKGEVEVTDEEIEAFKDITG